MKPFSVKAGNNGRQPSRAAAALEAAGVRIRRLERQLAARENNKLIEAEIARQFAVLLDLLDQHLGIAFVPDDLRRQLALLVDFLGMEWRW
jgi:hypothetical protein